MADLRQARITSIKYKAGVFDDAKGTKKFIRAPFDLVMLRGEGADAYEQYIQPRSIGASDEWYNATLSSISTGNERQGIGYLTDEMVIPPSNLGDFEGNADNWRGCFKIGQI